MLKGLNPAASRTLGVTSATHFQRSSREAPGKKLFKNYISQSGNIWIFASSLLRRFSLYYADFWCWTSNSPWLSPFSHTPRRIFSKLPEAPEFANFPLFSAVFHWFTVFFSDFCCLPSSYRWFPLIFSEFHYFSSLFFWLIYHCFHRYWLIFAVFIPILTDFPFFYSLV